MSENENMAKQTASSKEIIVELIATHFGRSVDSITDSTDILTELGADSLDMLELVIEMEEEFDVTVPDYLYRKCRTVGDVVKLAEHLGK